MSDFQQQKQKLEQKKNRIQLEETRLKIKERKLRTRHLIEVGGLVKKAELDHLPKEILYGALLSITRQLKQNSKILDQWSKTGREQFQQEQSDHIPIILTFTQQPSPEIRKEIRNLGLRWNRFRAEWYGNITDLEHLKFLLKTIEHKLEFIS